MPGNVGTVDKEDAFVKAHTTLVHERYNGAVDAVGGLLYLLAAERFPGLQIHLLCPLKPCC